MANSKLAKAAIDAVYHGNWEYPLKRERCQQFVRECIETAHGESISESIRAGTAKDAVSKWKARGWGFPASQLAANGGLQEGDCLYKTTGKYGHVGIAVKLNGKWMVAENSSTGIGRVRGALGFRTLSQFDEFEYVGRLPDTVTGTSEIKPKTQLESIREHVKQLKSKYQMENPRVFLQGLREVELKGAKIEDGVLYVPIKPAMKGVGWKITKITDNREKDGKYHVRAVPEKK